MQQNFKQRNDQFQVPYFGYKAPKYQGSTWCLSKSFRTSVIHLDRAACTSTSFRRVSFHVALRFRLRVLIKRFYVSSPRRNVLAIRSSSPFRFFTAFLLVIFTSVWNTYRIHIITGARRITVRSAVALRTSDMQVKCGSRRVRVASYSTVDELWRSAGYRKSAMREKRD